MTKHLPRTFCFSLFAVLALMAATAMVAHAENLDGKKASHTPFLVLGSTNLAISQTFTAQAETTTNQILIPGLNGEINCEKFTITEGVLLAEGIADTKILFEKCKVFSISPLEALPCEIIGPGNIEHITVEALLLAVLHENIAYLLAEPKVEPLSGASAFAEIKFKKGTGCLLSNPVKITGTFALNVTQTHVAEPLVSAASHEVQLLLGDLVAFGVNDILIDGSAKFKLTGAGHKGCTWGAV